jgi:hypothetical protein
VNNYEIGGCTWIMNIMHGKLHHLRMRAFMLTPFGSFIVVGSGSSVTVCVGEFKPFPYHAFGSMAPVVRVEPNGNQALLMFDNARQDLTDSGWLTFVKRFEGFNLCVARQFSMTFDGCRAKVRDIQLEIDEQFISSAMGLPTSGQRWFKNCKVKEVSWTLLFQLRKVTSCDRGMPITMLKQRWHDLLMIIKQFVTCEGRYGFVFLYHLRLLMIFIGYPLNMPFYFHRSLYKMSKKYKRHKADNSLFHHGLIKLIIVYHLSFLGDSWKAFIARNGFEDTDPVQVDKPMVTETKAVPLGTLTPPTA